MEKLRVLIVDDSVIYRSQIKAALSTISFVDVVAVASNGRLALQRLAQEKVDLLVLDLEMPEMDGIETLKQISALNIKCKAIVFSSVSKRSAELTLEALQYGASDFIAKPGSEEARSVKSPEGKILDLLQPRIEALFSAMLESEIVPVPEPEKVSWAPPLINLSNVDVDAIVIASSTGGPTVLEKMFSELRGPICKPIFIVQHMPPIFTATLAERIEKITGIPTREAVDGEVVTENRIYIAPGDFHMKLARSFENVRLEVVKEPLVQMVRPAADPLFTSAANVYGERCLAFVLTGMGADGRDGSIDIKNAGGTVVIQSQESCVVFGMPGAVKTAGSYDAIQSPHEIINTIRSKTSVSVKRKTA